MPEYSLEWKIDGKDITGNRIIEALDYPRAVYACQMQVGHEYNVFSHSVEVWTRAEFECVARDLLAPAIWQMLGDHAVFRLKKGKRRYHTAGTHHDGKVKITRFVERAGIVTITFSYIEQDEPVVVEPI